VNRVGFLHRQARGSGRFGDVGDRRVVDGGPPKNFSLARYARAHRSRRMLRSIAASAVIAVTLAATWVGKNRGRVVEPRPRPSGVHNRLTPVVSRNGSGPYPIRAHPRLVRRPGCRSLCSQQPMRGFTARSSSNENQGRLVSGLEFANTRQTWLPYGGRSTHLRAGVGSRPRRRWWMRHRHEGCRLGPALSAAYTVGIRQALDFDSPRRPGRRTIWPFAPPARGRLRRGEDALHPVEWSAPSSSVGPAAVRIALNPMLHRAIPPWVRH